MATYNGYSNYNQYVAPGSRVFRFTLPLNPFRPLRWLNIELFRVTERAEVEGMPTELDMAAQAQRPRHIELDSLLNNYMTDNAIRRSW